MTWQSFLLSILIHSFSFVLLSAFIMVSSPYFFGLWAAPQLFVGFLAFYAIYRDFGLGIFFTYALGIWMASVSSTNPFFLWTLLLFLFVLIKVFRDRIYWEGLSYFFLVSTGVCLSWPFFLFFFSMLFEPSPMGGISFLESLFRSLITLPFLPLIYALLKSFDHWMQISNEVKA